MFGVNAYNSSAQSAVKARKPKKPLVSNLVNTPMDRTPRTKKNHGREFQTPGSASMSIDGNDSDDQERVVERRKPRTIGKENKMSQSRRKSLKSASGKVKKRAPGSGQAESQRKSKRRRVTTPSSSRDSTLLDEDDLATSRQHRVSSTPARPRPPTRTPATRSKRRPAISATARFAAGQEEKQALGRAHKDKGNKFYAEQDYERAVQEYCRAIELDPSCAVYYSNRAAARLMQNSFREAAQDCEAALALAPGFARAHIRAARAYACIGEVEMARKHLSEVEHDRPDEAKELFERCAFYEKLIDQGDRLLGEENLKQCAEIVNQAEKVAPGSRRVYLLKHTADLVYAATNGESETRGRYIIVGIKAEIGAIVTQAQSARRDVDTFAADLYHYGKVLLYCALTTEARLLFSFAAQLHPMENRIQQRIALVNEMERYLNSGSEAFANNDFQSAITSFNAALNLDSSNAAFNGRMHFRLAAAYMSLNEYQAAIRHCTYSLQNLPRYHKARIRRAHAYVKLGQYPQAIAELEAANKLDPSPAIAKELEGAKALHERARRKNEEKKKSENFAQRKQQEHYRQRWYEEQEARARQQRAREQEQAQKAAPSHQYNTRHSASKPKNRRNSLDALLAGDHYQALGVSRKSSMNSIKKAFRTKALRYHPDKSRSPNATVKFKRVNEAYNILKSPGKKRMYDQSTGFSFYC